MKQPKYYGRYLLSDALKFGLAEATNPKYNKDAFNLVLVKSLNQRVNGEAICEPCVEVLRTDGSLLCKYTNKPGGVYVSSEMIADDFTEILLIKRDWVLPS